MNLALSLALVLMIQPPRPAPPVVTNAPSVLERARALTLSFYKGEDVAVWTSFSDQMKKGIGSLGGLKAVRAQVEAQAGVEEAVLDEKIQSAGGMNAYLRVARFSKAQGPVLVQWAFGPNGLVEGFFIRPAPVEAPSDRLNYVNKTVLSLPFSGSWYVFWGGRTLAQNYHTISIDQRFAYDIVMWRNGQSHAGEGKRNQDYYCFGQKITAPAAGTVVTMENGIDDNVPGVMNPKQPMGNHVILDHGNGEFSFLAHFRKGTVAVKPGDQVKAGDLLGLAGNSGNSSEPHLHYHLQDTATFGQGHGLPAAFSEYIADGKPIKRGEPLRGQTIEAR